jgi:hypothetical protein
MSVIIIVALNVIATCILIPVIVIVLCFVEFICIKCFVLVYCSQLDLGREFAEQGSDI